MTDKLPFLIYGLDLLFILAASRFRHGLMMMAALNLLCIVAFGATQIQFLGFVTNLGCPFYAAVMLIMSVHAMADAKDEFLHVTNLLFITMLARIVFSGVIQDIPFDKMVSLMSGCFLAFYVSQFLNRALLLSNDGSPLWQKKIGANATAQLVDSCLFFPIAMVVPAGDLWNAILGGFLLKTLLNIVDTPIFLWLNRQPRNNL